MNFMMIVCLWSVEAGRRGLSFAHEIKHSFGIWSFSRLTLSREGDKFSPVTREGPKIARIIDSDGISHSPEVYRGLACHVYIGTCKYHGDMGAFRPTFLPIETSSVINFSDLFYVHTYMRAGPGQRLHILAHTFISTQCKNNDEL